jgi:biotin carboxyl carrier protein
LLTITNGKDLASHWIKRNGVFNGGSDDGSFPTPGIFYRKPAPDQPPHKNQGDAVTAGDTMSDRGDEDVYASHRGAHWNPEHFLIEDEDEVMAGQPLYEIEA